MQYRIYTYSFWDANRGAKTLEKRFFPSDLVPTLLFYPLRVPEPHNLFVCVHAHMPKLLYIYISKQLKNKFFNILDTPLQPGMQG